MALSLTYWILAAYLLLGSISIGYMFLRTGWPKVRALELPYKTGWSAILGLIFAAVSVIGSLAIDAFFPAGLGSGELLLVVAAAAFIATMPLLTVRRKFFSAKKVRVHVPKEVVGAKLVAAKAVDKLMFDRAFIDASGLQLDKISELRKALGRKRAEATAAAAVPARVAVMKEEGAKPAEIPGGKPAEALPEMLQEATSEIPGWMKEEKKAAAPVAEAKPQFMRTAFERKISEAAKRTAEDGAKIAEEEKMKIAVAEEKKKAVQPPAAKPAAGERPGMKPAAKETPEIKPAEIEIGWGAAEKNEKEAAAAKTGLGEEEKRKKIQELKDVIRKAREQGEA